MFGPTATARARRTDSSDYCVAALQEKAISTSGNTDPTPTITVRREQKSPPLALSRPEMRVNVK